MSIFPVSMKSSHFLWLKIEEHVRELTFLCHATQRASCRGKNRQTCTKNSRIFGKMRHERPWDRGWSSRRKILNHGKNCISGHILQCSEVRIHFFISFSFHFFLNLITEIVRSTWSLKWINECFCVVRSPSPVTISYPLLPLERPNTSFCNSSLCLCCWYFLLS